MGTHPHLVQQVLYDESAGTLVAYSLGDFYGDGSRGGTNYSIILDVEITKDDERRTTKVTGYSYTPIYTVCAAKAWTAYSGWCASSRPCRPMTAISWINTPKLAIRIWPIP